MNQVFLGNKISNNSKLECHPYSKLALIYDRMMQHVEYDRWAKYIQKVVENYGHLVPRILDIGCGSGQFIKEISKLNISADGCDFSPQMLKIASQKNPQSNFFVDKMPSLLKVPPKKYTVFTCLYDTINYLKNYVMLIDFLNRVYALLPEKGLFIFDAVSQIFCQHYFNNLSEDEIIDNNLAYSRISYYNAKNHLQSNEILIYTPEGIFEEIHTQKIFSFKKLKKMIKVKTQFELIAVYDDFSFFDAEEDSNRAHFILRRNLD